MLTTRVLRSVLLVGLASAGLALSDAVFAEDDAAPAEPTANEVDAGTDSPDAGAAAGPVADPRLLPAQTPRFFGFWLDGWPALGHPQELPQPFPPQSEKELAYIDQVLTHWERQSAKIRCYRTEFSRWVTDPVFGPADTFKTFSKGELCYELPDKGLFRVDATAEWTPPADAGGKRTYPDMGDAGKEQWIWNGKALFEFNYGLKALVERQLPQERDGQPIAYGLLPMDYGALLFVFGANKETIQSRYWLRATGINRAQKKGEYWFEAYPKFIHDAVSHSKIEFVIAGEDFLLSSMKVHEPHGLETIYQFTNRSTNWKLDPKKDGAWDTAFAPATPPGWERIVEPAPGAAAAP